jgi:hypothetical protein
MRPKLKQFAHMPRYNCLPHRTVTKAYDDILISEPSTASVGGVVATASYMSSGNSVSSRGELFMFHVTLKARKSLNTPHTNALAL